MKENQHNKYAEDIKLANSMNKDSTAFNTFLDRFSDRVFTLAMEWNKVCYHKNEKICEHEGKIYPEEPTWKAYHWIIGQLRNKVPKYKGKGPLDHFVKAILTKQWLRNDYIRHIKGDKRYIPKCLESASEIEKKVFQEWRRQKTAEKIAEQLNIDLVTIYDLMEGIKKILMNHNKLYMVEPKNSVDFNDDLNYNQEEIQSSENEYHLIFQLYYSCIYELSEEEKLLLHYKINKKRSYDFIVGRYKETGETFIDGTKPQKLEKKQVKAVIQSKKSKLNQRLRAMVSAQTEQSITKKSANKIIIKTGVPIGEINIFYQLYHKCIEKIKDEEKLILHYKINIRMNYDDIALLYLEADRPFINDHQAQYLTGRQVKAAFLSIQKKLNREFRDRIFKEIKVRITIEEANIAIYKIGIPFDYIEQL